MANIRNRNGKWQVQVRRLGHSPQARSFLTKSEAQRWARQTEAELDRSFASRDPSSLRGVTIADLLKRYCKTVTSLKRGTKSEGKRIETFLREDWSKLSISHATPLIFAQFRDRRSRQVSPGTIIRELGLLRAIFETAKREWGFPLAGNPLATVKKPRAPEGRKRRLLPGELEALMEASRHHNDGLLSNGILLAIETGMRRGELLGATWEHFNSETSTLHLPITKTDIRASTPPSESKSLTLEDTSKPDEVIKVFRGGRQLEHQVLLIVGSAGAGKTTFVDYLREVALPSDLKAKTVWLHSSQDC